jgi:SPP1 family predicted phage head-tail adaptor
VIEAGKLRHLVEIQGFTTAQDSSGDDVKTYADGSGAFAHVHAEIKTLRGRELIAAQTEFAEADVQITIRYLDGLTERMRVLHDGIYYDILNVNDIERLHRVMVLTCKTGVADDR